VKREFGETVTSCHLELLKESLGKLLQAASESCEARVWGNCYKLPFRAAK